MKTNKNPTDPSKPNSPGAVKARAASPGRVPEQAHPDVAGMSGKSSMPAVFGAKKTSVVTMKHGSDAAGVICNSGGDAHSYLGHFRSGENLKRGHNAGAPYPLSTGMPKAPTAGRGPAVGGGGGAVVEKGGFGTPAPKAVSSPMTTGVPQTPTRKTPAVGQLPAPPKPVAEPGGFGTPKPKATMEKPGYQAGPVKLPKVGLGAKPTTSPPVKIPGGLGVPGGKPTMKPTTGLVKRSPKSIARSAGRMQRREARREKREGITSFTSK